MEQRPPRWPETPPSAKRGLAKRDLAMFNLAIDSKLAAAISSAFGSMT
jgi:hypothetical protein